MDYTVLTDEQLMQQFTLTLVHRTGHTREIVQEFGRRGLREIDGEPVEQIFNRNPIFKKWYELGQK